MIDKGRVVRSCLLKLGKNDAYNDNKTDEYRIAEDLLENIIDNIAKETTFLFNSTTVKLTSVGKNELGEYKFNPPIDNLNIIRANTKKFRTEGEFIYSNEKEIYIQYCRDIQISEYPDNLFDYLVAALCVEMCLSFNAYQDRIGYFENLKAKEKYKIIIQQGFNNNPWG